MDPVSFIRVEQGDALILSFVIEDAESGDVKSLILMRSPKYESLLDAHERGVNVSREDEPDREDNILRRILLAPDVVTIESTYGRYDLDVSRVDKKELQKARTILRGMNFDDAFTLDLVNDTP